MRKCYKAIVPGSLMLFGEHAVLFGKTALVSAIDKYITVALILRDDDVIHIKSLALGEYVSNLRELDVVDDFKFVLTAIKSNLADLKCGFDLLIESDFSHTVGFGSSAAVTVATVAVLRYAVDGAAPDEMQLFQEAFRVVQHVQQVGSGADVAASVFGGVLAYRRDCKSLIGDLSIKKLSNLIPLTVVYSGCKVKTPIVIKQVQELRSKHLLIFDHIYELFEQCVVEAERAIENLDLERLGELMNIHQGLQDAIGVNNSRLAELIFALRGRKEIKGAKISGAGLGDCVIGLGRIDDFGEGQMEVALVSTGVRLSNNLKKL